VRLEGIIAVRHGVRLRKISGAGSVVMLLPGSGLGEDTSAVDAQDVQRLEELDSEAAEFKKRADRALTKDNFTEATEERDRHMNDYRRVLSQRTDVLAALHGRHEAVARNRAVLSRAADEQGYYIFSGVEPGTYTVYARLVKKDLDLEWMETVTVGSDAVRVDLDQTTARGLPPRKK
jgi:hypothetical protein